MYKVREINLNDNRYIRGGIIPITTVNDINFYGFGMNNRNSDICDFGGHKETMDNDILDAAIREYREESLNVFGEISRDTLYDCYVLEGNDTVEILYPIRGNFIEYTKEFNSYIKNVPDHEVQSIIWLTYKQMFHIIDNEKGETGTFAGVNIFKFYNRIAACLNLYRNIIY